MDGDPTGPAARHTQFPVGVSFGAIQGPDVETQSEEDYALAVMEATYGKPATMEDYQQLLTTGKRLYGSTQIKPPPAKPRATAKRAYQGQESSIAWQQDGGAQTIVQMGVWPNCGREVTS